MASSLCVRRSSSSKVNVTGVPGHRRAVKASLILDQWEKLRANSLIGLIPSSAGADRALAVSSFFHSYGRVIQNWRSPTKDSACTTRRTRNNQLPLKEARPLLLRKGHCADRGDRTHHTFVALNRRSSSWESAFAGCIARGPGNQATSPHPRSTLCR